MPDDLSASGKTGGGTWAVFAGLQLVVFVFFVYLVGTATPDVARTELTLASVRNAFAGLRSAPPDDAGPFEAGTSALTELGGDLAGRVRLGRVERSRRGEELILTLPAAELFAAGDRAPRDAAIPLMDRIVTALSVPPAGYRMLLTVTFGSTPGGAAADGLAIGRAAGFAAAMTARGAYPGAIAVGLGPVEPGHIRLVFRLSATPATQDPGR